MKWTSAEEPPDTERDVLMAVQYVSGRRVVVGCFVRREPFNRWIDKDGWPLAPVDQVKAWAELPEFPEL